jgi:predicted ATPase
MMIATMNSKCSPTMLEILKTASCIGNYFSFEDLQEACAYSTTNLRLLLREAVKDGWLVELTDSSFKFNHDKLQESAYKLMDRKTMLHTHHHLGKSILSHTTDIDEKLFDIVQHLNKSIDLIIEINDRNEINQLLELNCKAIKVALAASAAVKAVELAEQNLKLVPSTDEEWKDEDYEQLYNVYLYYGEALRVARNHTLAEAVLKKLLNKVKVCCNNVIFNSCIRIVSIFMKSCTIA